MKHLSDLNPGCDENGDTGSPLDENMGMYVLCMLLSLKLIVWSKGSRAEHSRICDLECVFSESHLTLSFPGSRFWQVYSRPGGDKGEGVDFYKPLGEPSVKRCLLFMIMVGWGRD